MHLQCQMRHRQALRAWVGSGWTGLAVASPSQERFDSPNFGWCSCFAYSFNPSPFDVTIFSTVTELHCLDPEEMRRAQEEMRNQGVPSLTSLLPGAARS
ncbi:ER membrane protein complex subunit-like protein [Actinidia rufa]|uniref:ER membrane protein complex subunit-like protein n=1 Tax=Actinidia rufa TaxID=165716 RepID=A0A7J0FDY2_9ERIC|nr:ER membrane protein complex subunit-like protein [Actinidia rufa]